MAGPPAAEGSKATAMLNGAPVTLLTPVAITRAVSSSTGLPTAPSWGWAGRKRIRPCGVRSTGCSAPTGVMVWMSPLAPEW